MRKLAHKLTLNVESLRVLDSPELHGAAAATAAASCPPTCGNIPAPTDRAAVVGSAKAACCV